MKKYKIKDPNLIVAVRGTITPETPEKFGNVNYEAKLEASRVFLKSLDIHDILPLINLKRKNA